MEYEFYVGGDGEVEHVYSDDLAGLFTADGAVSTTRVSHVEPHPCGGGWLADMGPVDGPILAANGECIETGDTRWNLLVPFATRQEALDAEVAWVRAEMARRSVAS